MNAGWVELQLRGLPREEVDLVSARLFEVGASGVQEDHLPGEEPSPLQPWDTGPAPAPSPRVLLRAWFESRPLAGVVEGALGPVEAELAWAEVEDVDWESRFRAGFTPIRVSDRLVVAPPWDAPPGALIIEPGQGFGSGAHPTTLAMLRAVDELSTSPHRTALDLGCGSGILALAAAHLGLSAEGVDVDEAAVADARANATRNGLEVRFSTTPVHALTHPADLVLANLHAELLVELAPELVRLTRRWLVLAGILADREHLVRAALDPRGVQLAQRDLDGEWVALRYRVP